MTEDNMMFKSWIKDIAEKFTDVSGVPPDQRLIGTDAHREYVCVLHTIQLSLIL